MGDIALCIPSWFFCCWTGINALLYLATAIMQWLLIGNQRTDRFACLTDVALGGAIFSSLATLINVISGLCDCYQCCCHDESGLPDPGLLKCLPGLLKILQLGLKYGALICTAYLASNRVKDGCGTAADPIGHPELINAVACLELVSSILTTITRCCHFCFGC